jgi:hypothetical protein
VTHEDTRRLSRIAAFVDWLTDAVASRRERFVGRAGQGRTALSREDALRVTTNDGETPGKA